MNKKNIDEKWDGESTSPTSRRRFQHESIPVTRSGRVGGGSSLFSFQSDSLNRYELPPSPSKTFGGSGTHSSLMTRNNTSSLLHQRLTSSSSHHHKISIRNKGRVSQQQEAKKKDSSKVIRIEDVHSGQDAIRFFALHGNDSPVKFLHLNRAPRKKGEFRPYDLTVVPQSKVNAEHFTISSAGVVRVCKGEPSEFTSLPDWMRELTIFNVIRSINFFKYYRVIKIFRMWRDNVRFKLYCNQRKKLAHKLFYAKRTFCRPLMQVNACLQSMNDVRVLDLSSSKAVESSTFVQVQEEVREEAAKTFDDVMEKGFVYVREVCQKVSQTAKLFRRAKDVSAEKSLTPKTKSIVVMKQNMKNRKRRHRRAEQELEMLDTFIRLCDYIMVENLLQLCIDSHLRFYKVLTGSIKRAGVFEISVQFDDNGCVFHPTNDELQNILKLTTKNIIDMVDSIPRVLYTQPFKSYISQSVSQNALKIANVVKDSKLFTKTINSIQDKTKSDFEAAADYTKVFEHLRPIYEAGKVWDVNEYKSRDHTGSSVRQDLIRVSGWERDVEKMKPQQIVGTLYVESRKLRHSFAPTIEGILHDMKSVLIDLASKSCEHVLDQYKNGVTELSNRPETVTEFAKYIEKNNELDDRSTSMKRQKENVEEMYVLYF